MATVKVKFRPSSVADREGSIYYQIIHERKVRHYPTGYRLFPHATSIYLSTLDSIAVDRANSMILKLL